MIVYDSNILIHAFNRSSPHQSKASALLREALNGERLVAVTPQVLAEFYSVATNPKRMEHPIPASGASAICSDILTSQMIKYLPDFTVLHEGLQLAAALDLKSARVYDCLIAAAARRLGAEAIYTENDRDFARLQAVSTVNPFE